MSDVGVLKLVEDEAQSAMVALRKTARKKLKPQQTIWKRWRGMGQN